MPSAAARRQRLHRAAGRHLGSHVPEFVAGADAAPLALVSVPLEPKECEIGGGKHIYRVIEEKGALVRLIHEFGDYKLHEPRAAEKIFREFGDEKNWKNV